MFEAVGLPPREQNTKHMVFFEALAACKDKTDPDWTFASAGLLALRLVDHWKLVGPPLMDPEAISIKSCRGAIMDLAPEDPSRPVLISMVNTMQVLREYDATPILPKLLEYGLILERHFDRMSLAADVYDSIIHHAWPGADNVVVADALERRALAYRKAGDLDEAEQHSAAMTRVARAVKDRPRELRGRLATTTVVMQRGDLDAADKMAAAIVKDATKWERKAELAKALHTRAVIAIRDNRLDDGISLAHQALRLAEDPMDRDRVLSDLAAALTKAGAFDAAADAFAVIALTATTAEVRQSASANLVVIAARAGDEAELERARARLEGLELPPELRLNVMIESARGLARFGRSEEATELLADATSQARELGFEAALSEGSELLRHVAANNPALRDPARSNAAPPEVAAEIRELLTAAKASADRPVS
ncbi:MAG: hypothetical protein FJ202_02345 [Gemmatimonadetes bacterium]|nr:hypothetical protein [Gemmatimonadota bacterium]